MSYVPTLRRSLLLLFHVSTTSQVPAKIPNILERFSLSVLGSLEVLKSIEELQMTGIWRRSQRMLASAQLEQKDEARGLQVLCARVVRTIRKKPNLEVHTGGPLSLP